jgi:hypothetical protein
VHLLSFQIGSLPPTAKKALGLLTLVVALLAVSVPMFSQAAVGTILGGVFDSSGAVIVGAKVTITDAARGTTRVLTSDGTGEFNAPSLLAGTYTVRAEAKGFQSVEHSNVLLEVAGNTRVDLTLPPGEQTQTVTVTEEAPAIDTTSSTLGGTVTNQSIVQLPLISRNFLNLMELRPGVVNISPGTAATTTVTNGRRQGADVLVVEGVTQFDLATSNVLINGSQKGGGGTQFPLDAVQEFNTSQNSPAEYGWRDGSAINLGVKSGTNSIHGSAYAFGRLARATDARSFSATGLGALSNLQVENPGAAVGGRIIKDKLFWFAAVEFVRQSSTSTLPVAVPTDVAAAGGVVSMVDACNAVGRANVNPLSAQIAGLPAGSCTPQPGTAAFENLFPANTTNSQVVFPYNPTETPSNNGLAKIDYSPNDKNHISGIVYISRQSQLAVGNLQPGGLDSPYWGSTGPGSTSLYAGSWTYTPNSTWVNDLRAGAAPNSGNSINGDINRIAGNPYGPTGYGVNTGVTNPLYGGLPCLTIGAFTAMGDCGKNGIRGPQYQLDFSDKVSYLRGNHAFKFGYEEVFVHFDDGSTQNGTGTLTFDNLQAFLVGNFTTNNGTIVTGDQTDHYRERWHAAFVQDTWRISRRVTLNAGLRWEYIGSPHSTVDHLGTFDPTAPGGVVQVGPDLATSTLVHHQKDNFNPRGGVAWDIFGNGKTVLRAGIGNLSSFPAILAVAGANVPYGQTLCAGPSNITATGAPTCTNPANIVVNNYGKAVQGFVAPAYTIAPGSLSWTTAGPIFPIGSGSSATSGPTCSTNVPCSMIVSNPNLKNPRSLQWNVDIQRALTNNLTLDVAYVGTHGYNEIHSADLNEPAVGTGWDSTAINAAACLPAWTTALGKAGGSASQALLNGFAGGCKVDSAAITAARPFPQFPYFQNISQSTNGFRSNYNGLQVTLAGRNFHGLNFLTAYTYSHALDDWTKNSQATSALADPSNPNYQYGSSDNDLRHRFRFSPTYAIPGIKSPLQLLQGWQISAIWAYQTGFAWAPNDQKNNDFGGTGESNNTIPSPNNGVWQTWNYMGPKGAFGGNGANPIPCYSAKALGGCTLFSAASSDVVTACLAAAQAPYSNPTQQALAIQALTSSKGACYMQNGGILTPPAYGTLGNAGRGIFTGPRYQDWDFTLAKMWHVKERYTSQLRIECYNCFNHINFLQFSDGSSDPSAGGNVVGNALFGYHNAAQGSARQIQLGMKITF